MRTYTNDRERFKFTGVEYNKNPSDLSEVLWLVHPRVLKMGASAKELSEQRVVRQVLANGGAVLFASGSEWGGATEAAAARAQEASGDRVHFLSYRFSGKEASVAARIRRLIKAVEALAPHEPVPWHVVEEPGSLLEVESFAALSILCQGYLALSALSRGDAPVSGADNEALGRMGWDESVAGILRSNGMSAERVGASLEEWRPASFWAKLILPDDGEAVRATHLKDLAGMAPDGALRTFVRVLADPSGSVDIESVAGAYLALVSEAESASG